MTTRWEPGEVIVRREVLGLGPGSLSQPSADWHGRPWLGCPVYVVQDTDEQLVSYIAPGAELGFVDGRWPAPDGRHPWHGRRQWEGHGCLMVQRPGDHHAVWHFWDGADRTFSCWYINLQAAFRRTAAGYDTQDFELDLVVFPDGSWIVKDLDLLDQRVAEGRFSPALAEWIKGLGEALVAELESGQRWWDEKWVDWSPDPAWVHPRLVAGWDA
ncbi:MAG: DUF402 domain-containing protein [Acidimicrobiales bacterium]